MRQCIQEWVKQNLAIAHGEQQTVLNNYPFMLVSALSKI